MQNSSVFQYIAIDQIYESTTNTRRTFDEAKLAELAESIRTTALFSRSRYVRTRFSGKLEKGQLITLEGTLRYRDVETEQYGKQRFAEIHAASIKRLSQVESPDDPNDVAD